jgi:hypothetical protein
MVMVASLGWWLYLVALGAFGQERTLGVGVGSGAVSRLARPPLVAETTLLASRPAATARPLAVAAGRVLARARAVLWLWLWLRLLHRARRRLEHLEVRVINI